MTHKRIEIKNAVGTLLAEEFEIPVHVNKSRPSPHTGLPEINIYSGSEEMNILAESPRRYERRFSVKVDYLTKGNDEDEVFLAVDTVSNQIENLLQINENLNGLVRTSSHTRTNVAVDKEGSPLICGALMEFEYAYVTEVEFYDPIEEFDQTNSVATIVS
jgi:hypothetical protein